MKNKKTKIKAKAKKIALFNHKGGVSKTTTAFHLGWMLASKGHKVILIDADPQCNLTGLILGFKGPSELEKFYRKFPDRNIRASLAPAFESRPTPIQAAECVPVKGRSNLFLLPGHIRLSEYEVTLGIAQELSASIQTLQNLPGSFNYLFDETAKKYDADYLIIDMNPSLGSINQNLVMISDYFIVPTNPDFFSVMSIDSMATVLPKWVAWSRRAQSIDILLNATYPFPTTSPKFLGTIVQKFRPREGKATTDFEQWINGIKDAIVKKLIPSLRNCGLLLDEKKYKSVDLIDNSYCLETISDFNTLIAKSQKSQTPVFALTQTQIGHTGSVLLATIKSRDRFKGLFENIANQIEILTK